ncbi:MAG: hypothetical protein HKN86_04870 [Acidimicrobiia bacterium]|nr:hypothetical protein [Acidimicrobiia bacterium]
MHQYSLECDNCFSACEINFEERVPHTVYCPNCGAQHDIDDFGELDFDE